MVPSSGDSPLTPTASGIRLVVQVQPRAARSELGGAHGGALKVRLAAPPVDGLANEALVRFLAERLGVPRRNVAIVAGETGRRKVVAVRGVGERAGREALGLPPAPADPS